MSVERLSSQAKEISPVYLTLCGTADGICDKSDKCGVVLMLCILMMDGL